MSAQNLSAIQPDGKSSDLNLADFGFSIFSSFSVKSKIYDAASNWEKKRVVALLDRMGGRRRAGKRETVQNMLDAIFGAQLSGHLRFSHE